MKRYWVWMISLVMLAACNTGQDKDNGISPRDIKNPNTLSGEVDSLYPQMTFEKQHHNFGTVEQGEVVRHDFKFTNTGKANLIIANASSTCGCTIPEYPKKPIAPGESDKITVEFSSEGRANQVKKTVNIQANTNPGLVKVTIEAFVTTNKNR